MKPVNTGSAKNEAVVSEKNLTKYISSVSQGDIGCNIAFSECIKKVLVEEN
jgi:hypothetical protein